MSRTKDQQFTRIDASHSNDPFKQESSNIHDYYKQNNVHHGESYYPRPDMFKPKGDSSFSKQYSSRNKVEGNQGKIEDSLIKDYYFYPVTDWKEYKKYGKEKFYQNFFKKAPEKKLSDFERVKTLGTGTFGRVILVKDHAGDFFALKVMDKEHIVRSKQIENTIWERRILTTLKFPFTVHLEYAFKDSSYLYLVLPFIQGGELFTLLRRMGRFTENIVQFYASQVILALDYMHSMDLVYRDLKPENILLDLDGYIKITDFGFTKLIPKGRTYTLCGTPEYMAPEIIKNRGYGLSADWWALGILIYEMTAGYPPFSSKEEFKTFEKIIHGKYQMPSHFSTDLRNVVRGILEPDITRRLGCLRQGASEIQNYVFFSSINYIELLNRMVQSPMQPRTHGSGDTSYFSNYEEVPIIISARDKYPTEFENF